MKCDICGSTARDHTEQQCQLNRAFKPFKVETGNVQIVPQGTDCLHKNCAGCKSGICSGVHMLSCPCRSCTPWL